LLDSKVAPVDGALYCTQTLPEGDDVTRDLMENSINFFNDSEGCTELLKILKSSERWTLCAWTQSSYIQTHSFMTAFSISGCRFQGVIGQGRRKESQSEGEPLGHNQTIPTRDSQYRAAA
jgi:hypothetical protein